MKLAVDIGTTFFQGSGAKLQNITNVADLVSLFVKGSLALASVILLIFFIMGGIGMIAGAGDDDPKKIGQAKQSITTALIGFVIVFMAYWIVKLIVTILGVPNII
jgi:hypothetical protein